MGYGKTMKQFNLTGEIVEESEVWVYDWFGIPAVSASKMEHFLADAAGEDIEILINSGGGSVTAASEIYERLRSYTGKVIIKVVGMAASAAGVIAMAAESEITPTGLFMLHNASAFASGNYQDMDEASLLLRQVDTAIANAYMEKTGLEQKELFDLMDATTYLTAQEAVEKKFIDRISKNKQYSSNFLKNQEIPSFYNSTFLLPEETKQKMKQLLNQDPSRQTVTIPENKKEERKTNMKLNDLLQEYPDAKEELEQLLTAKKEEGKEKERARLKEIDEIRNAVPEDLLIKAKYDNPIQANELAYQVLQTTKTAGSQYFQAAITDSVKQGEVLSVPNNLDSDKDEELAAINYMAAVVNQKRGMEHGTDNE